MSGSDDSKGQAGGASSPRCMHLWQPYADAKHIWQKCVHCGEERHGPTHQEMLTENLAYIFRDVAVEAEYDELRRDAEASAESDEFCRRFKDEA